VHTRLITFFTAIVLAGDCQAQTSEAISLSSGLRVKITSTINELPEGQSLSPEMTAASGNSIYRIFRDENKLAVFAYELALQRSPDGTEVLLEVRPAGNDFASKFPQADGGKPTPTLTAPRTYPPLTSGKRQSIDLFDAPPYGKVADVVDVSLKPESAAAAGAGSLRFVGLTVKIGNMAAALSPGGESTVVTGLYVMFYIPGRGGYFFSTSAPEGRPFVKAGSIQGPLLKFTVENENYECTSQQPILAQSGSSEVWVYYDRKYKPTGNWTSNDPSQKGSGASRFFAAGSDSLDWFSVPKIDPAATP
jgi:hypothetical protein